MALNFMQAASRPVTNVQQYLEESASSPLKYSPSKGEVVRLYFPFQPIYEMGPNGEQVFKENGLMSYALYTHDLKPSAGKYDLCACLELPEPLLDANGKVINSGKCPFCSRRSDARAIVDYRMEMEIPKLQMQGLTGEALEKRKETVERELNGECKISYRKQKLYVLVAKFILDSKGNPEIEKDTGLPAYQFQIMRLSSSQLETIQKSVQQLAVMMPGQGVELPGGEIIVTYGDSDNKRDVVGNANYSACPPAGRFTVSMPALQEKIQAEATQFNWNDITKPYPEFNGMTDVEAERKVNDALKLWDKYQAELAAGNTNAVYAEYGVAQTTMPPLETAKTPALPNMQGALPNMQMPGQGAAPNFGAGFTPAQPGEVPNFGQGATEQTAAPAGFGAAPQQGTAQSFGAPQMNAPWGNTPWGQGVTE